MPAERAPLLKRSQQRGSKEKRILWVQPSHFRIGNDLHAAAELEIFRQLSRRGFSAYIVALRSKRRVQFRTDSSHVSTVSIPIRHVPLIAPVIYAISLFLFLPAYIVVLKPDFIIATPDVSIVSLIIPPFFSRFRKVKFILDIRSVPVETVGFRGFLQNFWFATSILVAKKLFDRFTIITSMMKKEVCNKFGLNPARVGVWTMGVSVELFDPKRFVSEKDNTKRKLGLYGKFVIFYHGAFTATRGLFETISSIMSLRLTHPDVVIFLLGKGPVAAKLKDIVREEKLQDYVVIHDPVDYTDVPQFIAMSDVCIVPLPDHPYWRLQCPLKILEYLAMEKVVILTDIPAHRSIIGDKHCGVYISSVEPTEIARSISYAYNNKESLEGWGKIGRRVVSEGYTWEKVAGDLENNLLWEDCAA